MANITTAAHDPATATSGFDIAAGTPASGLAQHFKLSVTKLGLQVEPWILGLCGNAYPTEPNIPLYYILQLHTCEFGDVPSFSQTFLKDPTNLPVS